MSGNTVNELQETQKRVSGLESPLAIHYKGITITPGGFLAAETVWRQHAEGADINTASELDSFSGSSQAHMSEFYGSGRQSRISLLAEGKIDNDKLDWLCRDRLPGCRQSPRTTTKATLTCCVSARLGARPL